MASVTVVVYAAGRRELFVLHDHVPTKKAMEEKSGFGACGIGVDSICCARIACGARMAAQAQNATNARLTYTHVLLSPATAVLLNLYVDGFEGRIRHVLTVVFPRLGKRENVSPFGFDVFEPAVGIRKREAAVGQENADPARMLMHDRLFARSVTDAHHPDAVIFGLDCIMFRIELDGISLEFSRCCHCEWILSSGRTIARKGLLD
jgi:hypothetical protein